MRRALPAFATAVLLLTGCSSASDREETPDRAPATETAPAPTREEPTPEPDPRTEVDWAKYPADYQRIIDEDTAEGDCTALQDTFDVAPNDPDLLRYIDEALELAGCYD